ncbi:NAD(P)-dependent alcohol dehydrogenase [Bacteroidota bacterium]
MKAVYINEYGGLDNLTYGDLPDPLPGKGEVKIQVAAVSVNPVDWKVREGRLKFLSGRRFPIIMGTELSGTVVELGENVSRFSVGDRVYAGLSHKGGAYAEYVAVPEKKIVRIPDELAFNEASTLAVAGVTALQAFTLHYRVKPGDTVLVNGASGGVGTYAVQIAKILGATVTAVCSERNAELVKELGADEIIDYNKMDFREREAAYDVILDAAANAFFPSARSCLKKGGMLIKLNLSLRSLFLGFWTKWFSPQQIKMILVKNRPQDLQWLIDHICSGRINVIIDKVYPLEHAREAQAYSMSGRARGKIIISVMKDMPV